MAILPSVPELLGLIVLMLTVAAGVTACVRRWSSSAEDRGEAFLQISLPLFGVAVTIVPYLPWLSDVISPLRALAGPIVRLIWFVVVGQVAGLWSMGLEQPATRSALAQQSTSTISGVFCFRMSLLRWFRCTARHGEL